MVGTAGDAAVATVAAGVGVGEVEVEEEAAVAVVRGGKKEEVAEVEREEEDGGGTVVSRSVSFSEGRDRTTGADDEPAGGAKEVLEEVLSSSESPSRIFGTRRTSGTGALSTTATAVGVEVAAGGAEVVVPETAGTGTETETGTGTGRVTAGTSSVEESEIEREAGRSMSFFCSPLSDPRCPALSSVAVAWCTPEEVLCASRDIEASQSEYDSSKRERGGGEEVGAPAAPPCATPCEVWSSSEEVARRGAERGTSNSSSLSSLGLSLFLCPVTSLSPEEGSAVERDRERDGTTTALFSAVSSLTR